MRADPDLVLSLTLCGCAAVALFGLGVQLFGW